jgi:transcriptional regulator GlxA family with amidase domain
VTALTRQGDEILMLDAAAEADTDRVAEARVQVTGSWRTDPPIDEISWRVGYEAPAFFRRLFKRQTGLAPGAHRKRFRIPDFAGL